MSETKIENAGIRLIKCPTEEDWMGVKLRALITEGKTEVHVPPTSEWKHDILEARHSPIRYLMYSFMMIGIPSWVATHLARHGHLQPYIASQRNDRQDRYDRNAARQDAPVNAIFDINAEELMVLANKRLCQKAAAETRYLVRNMCYMAMTVTPEFIDLLVPMCKYNGGICHEMKGCGFCPNTKGGRK